MKKYNVLDTINLLDKKEALFYLESEQDTEQSKNVYELVRLNGDGTCVLALIKLEDIIAKISPKEIVAETNDVFLREEFVPDLTYAEFLSLIPEDARNLIKKDDANTISPLSSPFSTYFWTVVKLSGKIEKTLW